MSKNNFAKYFEKDLACTYKNICHAFYGDTLIKCCCLLDKQHKGDGPFLFVFLGWVLLNQIGSFHVHNNNDVLIGQSEWSCKLLQILPKMFCQLVQLQNYFNVRMCLHVAGGEGLTP